LVFTDRHTHTHRQTDTRVKVCTYRPPPLLRVGAGLAGLGWAGLAWLGWRGWAGLGWAGLGWRGWRRWVAVWSVKSVYLLTKDLDSCRSRCRVSWRGRQKYEPIQPYSKRVWGSRSAKRFLSSFRCGPCNLSSRLRV
jgi:hypothetical protein